MRWEQLDDDLTYAPNELDRAVVAEDQIRTVIKTFREKLPEIFPGRTEVPKTLIYAKDDSHADDIVKIVREEFGKGNDFCQKITYRTATVRVVTPIKQDDGTQTERGEYKSSGLKAEDLLSSFRNSYDPRIVVTVDMIATGTDIKPLQIVMFMRAVQSRNFFEQMPYFLLSGLVSLQIMTEDGDTIEIAMIGREGLVGFPLGPLNFPAPRTAVFMLRGEPLRLKTDALHEEFERNAALQRAMLHDWQRQERDLTQPCSTAG